MDPANAGHGSSPGTAEGRRRFIVRNLIAVFVGAVAGMLIGVLRGRGPKTPPWRAGSLFGREPEGVVRGPDGAALAGGGGGGGRGGEGGGGAGRPAPPGAGGPQRRQTPPQGPGYGARS